MKNVTFGGRHHAVTLPPADLDLPFNQLLRRLRQSRRLRQVDLGCHAFMDASMISRLENGAHTPDASDVARLAAALHLTDREHDALRHAFERLVLRSRAPRSDILVEPLAALQLVDSQKGGGNRDTAGARTQEMVSSVVRTCRQQRRDPRAVITAMLRSPVPLVAPLLPAPAPP